MIALFSHQTEGILEKNQFLALFLSGYTFLLSVHSLIYTHTMYLKEGVKGKLPGPSLLSVGAAPVPCSAGRGDG